MLGLDLKQSRVYQDAKAEGREEGREEGRLLTKLEMVSLLLEVGLTIDQIAERLALDLEVVRQASNKPN
ncbi:MAG: hypothetical protein KME42_21930 [Tildeniella nuda ZEHNDER 1965/U140]|jgi:predicted transposase/invertase (TIGR01784 family)|nr:hypothetical protein [Tildeniella nuda ZEHNDER 1965/U140]